MAKLKTIRPKTKVDKPFRYFYCTKQETQPSLFVGGKSTIAEVSVGDVHIVFRGRLMCGESREVLKNRLKATDVREADTLPKNVPMCPLCSENFKKEPTSPWYKFVGGPNVRPE